jgi:hypothetical protein
MRFTISKILLPEINLDHEPTELDFITVMQHFSLSDCKFKTIKISSIGTPQVCKGQLIVKKIDCCMNAGYTLFCCVIRR